LMMVITFSVSISLFRKKNPLAKFFLIGHSLFVAFNLFAVLYYSAVVQPNYINSHGVGIGIVLEALTLAFIISYRIKILEDIRSKQDELKAQASTDPLTQLYNRRYFMTEGQQFAQKIKAESGTLSILTADIDHFKVVNDTYGHAVGDLVLVGVAHVFQRLSRDKDIVARFGGEEFVILLPDTNYAQALECAERIRQGVAEYSLQVSDTVTLKVTISIGVTHVDVRALESLENAINRADKALYQAKESGRNCVCGAEILHS
ncbi:MAG TPA: diguanylate cyclase, partial [Thiopseudomonas sp.]|nr:diguanylate cyclase [Thiopseudomonas sp.]